VGSDKRGVAKNKIIKPRSEKTRLAPGGTAQRKKSGKQEKRVGTAENAREVSEGTKGPEGFGEGGHHLQRAKREFTFVSRIVVIVERRPAREGDQREWKDHSMRARGRHRRRNEGLL